MVLFVAGIAVVLFSILVALSFLRRDSPVVRKTSLWLTILSSIIFIILSVDILIHDQPVQVVLLSMAEYLTISCLIDRLAAFFIFIVSVVSISVAIYSLHYIEESSSGLRRNLFVPFMNVFILSMILFIASDNAFSQLIFWELMSLTSFLLVMYHYEREETRKSGLFYFVMTQMSTVFLMLAIIIIFIATGSFNLTSFNTLSPALNAAVFISLLIGFGIKMGIVPFHKWLPYAHSASPSNISALMSGVMIKVAVYGLMRYVLTVLQPESWWGILILIFGTASAFLGVIYALKEHDIKRLLAYHSIENIGIILIGFGLYLIFSQYDLTALAYLSLAASLFHTLNHAVFKSLLFLTAGSVVEETGTRDIEKMGGMVKTMPFTAGLFLIGAVSISALPPLNGFVSELMLFLAFFKSFSIANPYINILLFISLSLFAMTSALAAACFVKAFGIIFLSMPRSEKARQSHEVSRSMLIGPGILALLCIVLGVFSYQIFQFFGYQAPIPNFLGVTLVLVVFMIIVIAVMYRIANRKSREADTWSCGLTSLDSRTEYTASGFSEPILTFFKPIYNTRKSIERNFQDKYRSVFKNGKAEIHVMKVFEEKIYLPIALFIQRVSQKVSDSHNVDMDTFILYSFIMVIILLIVVGWIL